MVNLPSSSKSNGANSGLFSVFFWEQTCLVYDRISSMLIAILWGYIIPLAFYPAGGCPSDNQSCWDFVTLLFGYIIFSTLFLPIFAVSIIKHCSLRVYELGKEGATTKRKYYISAQTLLLASVGTIWSVANSQFAYNAIRQVAYTGYHSYHILTVVGSKDMSGNILTETNSSSKWYPISDEFDDIGNNSNSNFDDLSNDIVGYFNDTNSSDSNKTTSLLPYPIETNTTWPSNRYKTENNTMMQNLSDSSLNIQRNNSEQSSLLPANNNLETGSIGSNRSNVSAEIQNGVVVRLERELTHSSSSKGSGEEVFVSNSPARAEMRWGMLASFCFGVGYTGLACVSISGVSTLCQVNAWIISQTSLTSPYGSVIQAYLIELGMLLQDNWYYVCGYSWQIFWSYAWFGSSLVAKNNVGPWTLMFLDVFRAVLFTCSFSSLAIYVVPLLLFNIRMKKEKLPSKKKSNSSSVNGKDETSHPLEIKSKRVLASEMILKHYDHLSVDDLLLRLVILSFKSTAVVVAVSIADLPTSFIISFLAHPSVLNLSMKKQLIYLTVIGGCGVLLFSVIEAKLGLKTLGHRFGHEVCSWVMRFIMITPWLRVLTIVTNPFLSNNKLKNIFLVLMLGLFGTILTAVFAIGSSVLHIICESFDNVPTLKLYQQANNNDDDDSDDDRSEDSDDDSDDTTEDVSFVSYEEWFSEFDLFESFKKFHASMKERIAHSYYVHTVHPIHRSLEGGGGEKRQQQANQQGGRVSTSRRRERDRHHSINALEMEEEQEEDDDVDSIVI